MLTGMETIGDRIQKARLAKGLSQAELAEKVGLTRSAINQLESGSTKNPRPETLFSLADELGIDPRELTFGERAAKESVDRMVFKLIDDMPEPDRQAVFDFTLYRAERAEGMIASEKIASYLVMIDKIKADMAKKRQS